MSDSLRILVCRHFLSEARAVIHGAGFEDVTAGAYRDLCSHPSQSSASRTTLGLDTAGGGDTVILGLCYLASHQDLPREATTHEVQREETCFSLFAPAQLIRQLMADGAYLLTPGWLKGWMVRLNSWGFDQPTATEFFRESARRLVLLDTGVMPGAEGVLKEMSTYIDLPAEVITVGLDHFRLQASQAVLRWRLGRASRGAEEKLDQTRRRLADHAMALDLLATLARTMSEEEAVQAILDLFSILLGARTVTYVPLDRGQPGVPRTLNGVSMDSELTGALLQLMEGEPRYARTSAGFCVRLRYHERELALLAVEDLSVPDQMEEYINLSLSIAGLLGLVISNSRNESKRQQADRALQSKSAELERSNAELSHFAYVISHDLQEPLRTITGFVNLLSQRYGEQLDDKAQQYIDFTVDGATRMKQLIEDLLRYSRVATHAQEASAVALGEVLDQVRGNLQAALEESGARLTVGELPEVQGDASQMLQLMQNLVGNALKFRGEEPPEVEISCARREGGHQISVRDNGIGMKMEMAERVFKIFQRLHTRDRYEGTGIGLAVCKRIVERHGGKIWVESAPGEGATFHFTMPDP